MLLESGYVQVGLAVAFVASNEVDVDQIGEYFSRFFRCVDAVGTPQTDQSLGPGWHIAEVVDGQHAGDPGAAVGVVFKCQPGLGVEQLGAENAIRQA